MGATLAVDGSLSAAALRTAGTTTFSVPMAGIHELTVTGGSTSLAGGSVETLSVTGGSLSTSVQLNVDFMEVTGGVVNTTTSQAVIRDGGTLKLPGSTFSGMGATMGLRGSDVLKDGVVTLLGGEVTVRGPVPTAPLVVNSAVVVAADSQLTLYVEQPGGTPPPPMPTASVASLMLTGGSVATVSLGPSSVSFGQLGGNGVLQWDGGAGQFSVSGTLSPGESAGALTVLGDVAMQDGSVFQFELGEDPFNPGEFKQDLLVLSGELNLASGGSWTLRLVDAGAPMGTYDPAERYPIIAYGTLPGGLGTMNVDLSKAEHWIFSGGSPTITDDTLNDWIVMTGLEKIAPVQWKEDVSGQISDPARWMNQAVPDGVDSVFNFLGQIKAAREVTVDTDVTIGTLNFDNSNSYTISGPGVLSFETSSGTPQIKVAQGDHVISAPLSFTAATVDTQPGTSLTLTQSGMLEGSLTKTGDGSLTIGDRVVLYGDLNHNDGVLEVDPGVLAQPSGGAVTLTGTATLKASGTVNRRVVGPPGSTLQATGPLDVGLLGAADGYAFQGKLVVGSNIVGLKDANLAVVRGGAIAGGTLASFNGINLLPVVTGDADSYIKGYGKIAGNVVAGTDMPAPTPDKPARIWASGGPIEFTGILSGAWTPIGTLNITGLARPGFSAYLGKVGASSTIGLSEIEIYGNVGQHDKLPPGILNDGNLPSADLAHGLLPKI